LTLLELPRRWRRSRSASFDIRRVFSGEPIGSTKSRQYVIASIAPRAEADLEIDLTDP